MKHLLITLSVLLFSSFIFSSEKKEQGKFTFPNGAKYTGELKDGIPNGQGKWTLPNGSQYVGEWKDGIEWRVTIYDKDGKIDGMVWIGVRQF